VNGSLPVWPFLSDENRFDPALNSDFGHRISRHIKAKAEGKSAQAKTLFPDSRYIPKAITAKFKAPSHYTDYAGVFFYSCRLST
jgi:hypothetical protein